MVIVLVVFGISIAFTIDSRNNDYVERKEEIVILINEYALINIDKNRPTIRSESFGNQRLMYAKLLYDLYHY